MKAIYLTVLAAMFSGMMSAQCSIDSLPDANQGAMDCYIDNVTLDGNPMSMNSGIQPTGNSYQSFSSPVLTVVQGQQYYLSVAGQNSGAYSLRAWIDFD